jgi:hypothetical protein
MEELLPLIIGILWLVYTFYTRGKKKKAPGDAPPKAKEKPSFLEQLLSAEGLQVSSPEPVDYEEDFAYELEEEPVKTPEKIESRSPFLNEELSQYQEEGQSQFREAFYLDEDDAGYEESEGVYSPSELREQTESFDLKKAVVFSAILDAPYIDYK